jgi:hypothetical protein
MPNILSYAEFIVEFMEHDPRHKKYGVYNSYISPSPDGSASPDGAAPSNGTCAGGSSAGASGGTASSGSGGGAVSESSTFNSIANMIMEIPGKQEYRNEMRKLLDQIKTGNSDAIDYLISMVKSSLAPNSYKNDLLHKIQMIPA